VIPQCNPKAGYLAHKQEIDAAIARVLNSSWYIPGEEVETFEREFSELGAEDISRAMMTVRTATA